ncbi:MAG: MFS transporter [Nitrospinota bacterium]
MSREKLPGSDERYGWVMVAVASAVIGIGAGSLTSISVFLIPLIADFGWQRGETAFAYTAATIALGVGGIVMGYLADRFSTRPVVLAGAIGLGISLLLLAQQNSLWQLYLFYCLLGGLGLAAFQAPLLANVGNWFSRNKGLALGVTTAGQALGRGLVPYIAAFLISTSGWREAYTTLGIISLVVLVPLALLVRSPPGLAEAKPASGKEGLSDHRDAYPIPPKISVAWLSAAVIFCCTCMATVQVHVVAMAQDKGIGAQSAAGILSLIFIAGFVGRVFFGTIADHVGGPRAYWLASASQTAIVFWFTQVHSLTGFTILALLFGLGFSGVMTCFTICVRELVPAHRRGVSIGIVFLFAWMGMGLGGYQGGFFFDLTGDYTFPFAIAVLAGVINLMIVGSLRYYITRKEAASAAELKTAKS